MALPVCHRRPHFFFAMSQFEQALALDSRKLIWGALMKALGAVGIALVVLYFADQQFAQGKFSSAAQQMAMQMRHSLGISERDDSSSNRHRALSFCLSMISAQTLSRLSRGKTGIHFSGSCFRSSRWEGPLSSMGVVDRMRRLQPCVLLPHRRPRGASPSFSGQLAAHSTRRRRQRASLKKGMA